MPDMIFVDSSSLEAVGYDSDSQELHVRFLAGTVYVYYEVPQQVVDALMSAPSKGSFYNRDIRNVYRFTKQ